MEEPSEVPLCTKCTKYSNCDKPCSLQFSEVGGGKRVLEFCLEVFAVFQCRTHAAHATSLLALC